MSPPERLRTGPRTATPSPACAGKELPSAPGQPAGACEHLPLGREAPALVVVEQHPRAAEFLTEDPVLLAEVLDSLTLALVEAAGEQQGQRLEGQVHSTKLPEVNGNACRRTAIGGNPPIDGGAPRPGRPVHVTTLIDCGHGVITPVGHVF